MSITFKDLPVSESLVRALSELHITEPTEIQEKTIPLTMEGKDVIAGSATGSGKTLAFGSCIVEGIEHGKGIQSIILTPTRELAVQVAENLEEYGKYHKLNVVQVYGGVSIDPQIKKLKSADVVVGTPGRVLDHLERETMDLSGVRFLVLDEADRMVDMGFIEDVEKIISQCPSEDRQTLLFSATISPEVVHISESYMKNPIEVNVESLLDPSQLKQVFYSTDDKLKFSLLVHLLKNEDSDLVMIFCNSKMNVDFVANNLKSNGITALAIHGGFSQQKRSRTLDKFLSAKKMHVLVCTDVAARGLDISGVTHVYNYDIPNDSKQYIHRIGRTARAGNDGIAINILTHRDHENFDRVLQEFAVDIKEQKTPYVERATIAWKPAPRGRGRGGFGGRNNSGNRGGFSRGSGRNNSSGGRGRPGGRGRSNDSNSSSGDRVGEARKKMMTSPSSYSFGGKSANRRR
jgi:ATP-dependent RNA helicase DeaD